MVATWVNRDGRFRGRSLSDAGVYWRLDAMPSGHSQIALNDSHSILQLTTLSRGYSGDLPLRLEQGISELYWLVIFNCAGLLPKTRADGFTCSDVIVGGAFRVSPQRTPSQS